MGNEFKFKDIDNVYDVWQAQEIQEPGKSRGEKNKAGNKDRIENYIIRNQKQLEEISLSRELSEEKAKKTFLSNNIQMS